jgi:carbonic anhydrase/acetyltransferase-like protein (isoleucine patch superfamily)
MADNSAKSHILDIMPIYALGNLEPSIHPEAFVHPDAVVIGEVYIGESASIWPNTVLRGDNGSITIGAFTSVQDGSVIHTTPEFPTNVGSNCLVGHMVHLEGCVMEEWSQASSGCVILHNARIGSGAIVAANAVVLNNTVVPPGALAVGTPAVIKEGKANIDPVKMGIAAYVGNAKRYRRDLRRID